MEEILRFWMARSILRGCSYLINEKQVCLRFPLTSTNLHSLLLPSWHQLMTAKHLATSSYLLGQGAPAHA